ncbi:murein hydrolase activator EnvC [Kitasatospora sp. NBC_00315]|uniref:murein hydrolase activator EnvC family protein n=1 Tax=Kitasatospora sp. NBC_00315 TaxID=2975963 RepID=UPI00325541FB
MTAHLSLVRPLARPSRASRASRASGASLPPPAPDQGRRALLLALLLTAVFLVALPEPLVHARTTADSTSHAGGRGGGSPRQYGDGDGTFGRNVTGSGRVALTDPAPGRSWPVGGPAGVLRRFQPPPTTWAPGHRGVDLVAAPDIEVRAAAPGVVVFSGVVAGRPVLTVSHSGSGTPPLRTTYMPVNGSVPVGTTVTAGQPIGRLATVAGHCGESCLHWGLLRGSRYLDPLALLGNGTARLLPLRSGS